MLYASLTASLFSAFLAMLGKQWLNRYASTGARGTAVERGRDRQQKFNGITTWYFEYVMESPPLMLQVALLLLGCALCRYLWEINITIALVILAVTSFGGIFYCFIVIAGAVFETCPYQTPGSRVLHSIPSAIPSVIRSTYRHVVRVLLVTWRKASETISLTGTWRVSRSMRIPPWLVAFAMCRALVHNVIVLGWTIVWLPVTFACWVYTWLHGVLSTPVHGLDQQPTLLDLQCISWILNTSLDKAHHLSALESLATMALPAELDPIIFTNCFHVFIDCVRITNQTVVITPGLEQLAATSITCLLGSSLYILQVDPEPAILRDVGRHWSYFRHSHNLENLPFFYTVCAIGNMVEAQVGDGFWGDRWFAHRPPSYELPILASSITNCAKLCRERRIIVPKWIFHFVLSLLSLDPLPPTSVVIDCLSIIAADLSTLSIDELSARARILDERFVHF